jgi:hypothetical protein
VEIDAQCARLDDQRSGDRIVVTLPGELFVLAEGTTLNCTAVNFSVDGAGIYFPETHGWVVHHDDKAIAVQFRQSLQFCPANVR